MKRVTGSKAKSGGLQDMINQVTNESSPGASPQLLARIVEYINRSPDRGSDKALKYMNNRFKQKHVKVQNLTLITLETCMKRCGHMFREKLPFSDLFSELRKVATLKRKADVQIYNKILALIEDWSEAIDLPAYRQELTELQNKAVRFPTRNARDLSEYKEGGTMNALGQPQALPPGAGSALRGEYDGPGSPPASGASPTGSRASTPYAYGGNGHFAPSPPKAPPANVASLPDNHLAAGQPAMKLRDDLFAAKNSADLLSEMLASISIHDPVDVKQDHVGELAGQCEAMLPRLATLAEQVTDEGNLNQTLAVHGDMEQSLIKYRNLLEVAEGRAPPPQPSPRSGGLAAASSASAPPAAAPPPAKQASLSLLDFDDDPNAFRYGGASSAAAAAAAGSAATASAVAASGAPHAASAPAAEAPPRPSPQDLLADLFDAPPAPASQGSGGLPPSQFGSQPQFGGGPPQFGGGPPQFGAPLQFGGGPPQFGGGLPQLGGPPQFGGGPPQFGAGGPPQQQAGWNGPVPSQKDTANPFGDVGGNGGGDSAASQPGSAKQGQQQLSAGSQGFAAFSEAPAFGGSLSSQGQAPTASSQGPPNFGGQPQQQQQPFGQAPPNFSQSPGFGPPPPQQFGQQAFSPQPGGPQGFGAFGDAPAFGGPPPFGSQRGGFGGPPAFGGPPSFGAPPLYGPQGGYGPPHGSGGFGAPLQLNNSFHTPPALPAPPQHQHQQPQQQPNFSSGQGQGQPNFAKPPPAFQQQPKPASPSFGGNDHSSGLIPAVKSSSPSAAGSANPFDDPPAPSRPGAGAYSKLQPPPPSANSRPAGGAAPKPSWPPPNSEDPFSDLGQLPPPIRR